MTLTITRRLLATKLILVTYRTENCSAISWKARVGMQFRTLEDLEIFTAELHELGGPLEPNWADMAIMF